MRVENSLNHSNKSSSYLPSRKRKEQENKKKHVNNGEMLQLSDETKLLNKLVYTTENQMTPIPFYFVNAAGKNVKLACEISKRIQNQANALGFLLNYTMIYETVIDIASQRLYDSSQWKPSITTEYEILTHDEKKLLEDLHNICVNKNVSSQIISETARNYIQIKVSNTKPPERKACAEIIVQHLKSAPTLTNMDVKRALSIRIKQYISSITNISAVTEN